MQDDIGCHRCQRRGCFSTSETCHAQCLRTRHVCGSDSLRGCRNCGHLCHESNEDERCPFYGLERGRLDWTVTNENDIQDTLAGTGGNLPHRSQVASRFVTNAIIEVDEVQYDIGYGNPRNGSANNCLIDSLRQCIGSDADCAKVRADLLREFRIQVEEWGMQWG